jgi:LPS O-antigen subunit length determinant protein (WzzB/FepE family)
MSWDLMKAMMTDHLMAQEMVHQRVKQMDQNLALNLAQSLEKRWDLMKAMMTDHLMAQEMVHQRVK